MAEVIWAEPALNDLDAIADYIALDNPEAARRLVQKIFEHVDHLESHPDLAQSRKSDASSIRFKLTGVVKVMTYCPKRSRYSAETRKAFTISASTKLPLN